MQQQYDQLKIELIDHQAKVPNLEIEISKLISQLSQKTSENTRLQESFALAKKEYDSLKSECQREKRYREEDRKRNDAEVQDL